MRHAKSGDLVRLYCAGRLQDGREFDLSPGRKPMEIIIGHGDLLAALEHALIGMVAGERKQVIVASGMGYGPYREDLVQVVARDHFPKGIEPKVGLRLRVPTEGYEVVHATVVKVTDSEITMDQNHPLAGEDAQFEVTLLEIVDF